MSSDHESSMRGMATRRDGNSVGSLRVDEQTMKLGLLMEAAHAQQALAETAVEALKAHARDLDALVREEIQRTLLDELQTLSADSRHAAEALRILRRTAEARVALWSVASTVLCCCAVLGLASWVLPSRAEIAALRATRDQLAEQVARLEQRGGRIELRRCGDADRLCVRVDRKAPVYGEKADYLIVKGY
jgi:hypothetical protein